jgi:hypothetical protein
MATWFPLGPDCVFAPRDVNFKRLSRRDEQGRQGLVNGIAVDPTDASTIYTTEAPTSGGNSGFRTDTMASPGCRSWTDCSRPIQPGPTRVASPCIR